MRWIQKQPEPAALAEYKAAANSDWKPTYSGLDKGPIRRALILEQGHLCCYCGGPIGERLDDCHIEHFVAQSTTDEALRLEYTNMLASCQGTDGRTRVPEHCGQARGRSLSRCRRSTPTAVRSSPGVPMAPCAPPEKRRNTRTPI